MNGKTKFIQEIEKQAAAKAISKTVRMFEERLGVSARGTKPSERRASLINQLEKKNRFFSLRFLKLRRQSWKH